MTQTSTVIPQTTTGAPPFIVPTDTPPRTAAAVSAMSNTAPFPIPVKGDFGTYKVLDDGPNEGPLSQLGKELVLTLEEFRPLRKYRIAFLWEAEGGRSRGQAVLGSAKLANKYEAYFGDATFVITLSADHLRNASATKSQVEAVLAEQLYKCGENKSGTPTIKPYDFVGFKGHLKRYGVVNAGLQEAVTAVEEAKAAHGQLTFWGPTVPEEAESPTKAADRQIDEHVERIDAEAAAEREAKLSAGMQVGVQADESEAKADESGEAEAPAEPEKGESWIDRQTREGREKVAQANAAAIPGASAEVSTQVGDGLITGPSSYDASADSDDQADATAEPEQAGKSKRSRRGRGAKTAAS